MLSTTFIPLLSLLTLLPSAYAHGQTKGISIGGTYYDAPNIYFDGDSKNQNTPIRKGYQASSPSYLLPQDFNNNNKMACEEAAAAPGVAKAKPGDQVTWFWEGATPELANAGYQSGSWVHAMGPTITYIAACNGDCRNVNAADLDWVKIQYSGLNGGSITDKLRSAMNSKPEPYRTSGVWAMAQLIEDGSTYTHSIPQGLKNGGYILRSEIIAVHNPLRDGDSTSGPQSYVACAQIEIENGGDVSLSGGTKAGSLYEANGYLAKYSVFDSPGQFNEVGPQLFSGGSSGGSSNNNNNGGDKNQDQNQGQGNTDNSNQNQNQNQGQQNNGNNNDNSNQGQQNQGGNNDQHNNGNGSPDNSNQNQNQGQGNNNNNDQQNNGQNQGGNDNNNQNQGQGNTDASNQNQGQNQGESQNQNSGNNGNSTGSGSGGKTCRRSRKAKRSTRVGATVGRRQVPAAAADPVEAAAANVVEQVAAVHAHQQHSRSLFGRRMIH